MNYKRQYYSKIYMHIHLHLLKSTSNLNNADTAWKQSCYYMTINNKHRAETANLLLHIHTTLYKTNVIRCIALLNKLLFIVPPVSTCLGILL